MLFSFGAWKIFEGIYKGYKPIQINAIQSFFLGITKIGSFLVFYYWFEPTLWIAIVSFLVGYCLVDLLYLLFLAGNFENNGGSASLSWATEKNVWKYSGVIFLANVVAVFLSQTDRLMIGYFLPDEQLGYYVAALKFATLILILMSIVRPITGTFFSDFHD
jgi:O-antigen/teichoic acid export membrane protein